MSANKSFSSKHYENTVKQYPFIVESVSKSWDSARKQMVSILTSVVNYYIQLNYTQTQPMFTIINNNEINNEVLSKLWMKVLAKINVLFIQLQTPIQQMKSSVNILTDYCNEIKNFQEEIIKRAEDTRLVPLFANKTCDLQQFYLMAQSLCSMYQEEFLLKQRIIDHIHIVVNNSQPNGCNLDEDSTETITTASGESNKETPLNYKRLDRTVLDMYLTSIELEPHLQTQEINRIKSIWENETQSSSPAALQF
jgi:hypothetical protein